MIFETDLKVYALGSISDICCFEKNFLNFYCLYTKKYHNSSVFKDCDTFYLRRQPDLNW